MAVFFLGEIVLSEGRGVLSLGFCSGGFEFRFKLGVVGVMRRVRKFISCVISLFLL